MMVHTNRQARGTIIVFGKIREAFAGINFIPVITQVIFTGFRGTLIGYGFSGAIDAAGTAIITKRSYTGIDRVIGLQGHIGNNTTQSKQRAHSWMNNGTMPAQFAEPCFSCQWYMQHIAVANRVLDCAGIA